MKWNASRRVLLGIVLVLFLGGPTPGAVGDCGDDEGAFVTAPDWCFEKGDLLCDRRWAMSTEPEAVRDAALRMCKESLNTSCPGATWDSGCTPPTRMLANACLNALADSSRLSQPESEIAECDVTLLCGGG